MLSLLSPPSDVVQPLKHCSYRVQARTLSLGPAELSLYIVPLFLPLLAQVLGPPPTVRL